MGPRRWLTLASVFRPTRPFHIHLAGRMYGLDGSLFWHLLLPFVVGGLHSTSFSKCFQHLCWPALQPYLWLLWFLLFRLGFAQKCISGIRSNRRVDCFSSRSSTGGMVSSTTLGAFKHVPGIPFLVALATEDIVPEFISILTGGGFLLAFLYLFCQILPSIECFAVRAHIGVVPVIHYYCFFPIRGDARWVINTCTPVTFEHYPVVSFFLTFWAEGFLDR